MTRPGAGSRTARNPHWEITNMAIAPPSVISNMGYAQAGPAGKGYPSYDLGDRHIVVLNDLRHPKACVLAYGHHALFSSGVSNSHALHPRLRPYSPVASKATVP